jgi:hypothetical protein
MTEFFSSGTVEELTAEHGALVALVMLNSPSK